MAASDANRRGKVIRPPRIVLAAAQSEALRDRLVAELGDLKSADEAAHWVHKNLPVKNTLASADAELVEGAFRERLAAIEGGQRGAASPQTVDSPSAEPPHEQSQALDAPETPAPETAVVRRRRVAAKTIRLRDKEHCKFVASQPCVCAAARRPRRITFGSRNHARSPAGSATNSRCQSAGSITANCTTTVMRPHGGRE